MEFDVIELGESKFLFIPFCGEHFKLHWIARGEISYIEKSDAEKSDSYIGWYTDGDSLYVDGWRYSAPKNWDTFEKNYNILKVQGIIQ